MIHPVKYPDYESQIKELRESKREKAINSGLEMANQMYLKTKN